MNKGDIACFFAGAAAVIGAAFLIATYTGCTYAPHTFTGEVKQCPEKLLNEVRDACLKR